MIDIIRDEALDPIEVLFDYYFETTGMEIPSVEAAYKDFSHSLLDVDPLIAEEIMSKAAVLCMEHERAGFKAGAKVCGRLLRGLSE